MNAAPVLSIRGLQIEYRTSQGSLPAVQGVDLDVRAGEVVALVGESGSGKSTTAHAVLRLLAENARVTAGAVDFEGADLLSLSERGLRRVRGARIGLVPQDPSVSLNPVKKVGDQVAEVLRRHGKADRRSAQRRAVELLAEVGLSEPERRAVQFPHELSGGMRQRVLIAIATACRPPLVIADEPTSALDVTVQATVLDRLDALIDEHGAAMLLVTHDLGVAADRADRIVVMQRGQIVEDGPAHRVLESPEHPYTRRLMAAAPSLNSRRILVRHRQAEPGAEATSRTPEPVAPLLRVDGISRTFVDTSRGGTTVAVDDVSFDLYAGRTLAIVGESGSGKTTTARIVARFDRPDHGSIALDGRETTGLTGAALRQLRREIQVVHQNPYASLDPRYTVRRTLHEALRAAGVRERRQREARAEELVEQVALAGTTLARKPRELSGGQRQRVAIARALAVRPRLLILDEPVSALDVSVQDEILHLLADVQVSTGLSYLFISHDLAVVHLIADDVLVMHAGVVVERGPTDEVLSTPLHPYTTRLISSIPGRGTHHALAGAPGTHPGGDIR